MSSKIPESAWGDVLARRAKNEPIASIARDYDCSPALIYSVLKRAAAIVNARGLEAGNGATPTLSISAESASNREEEAASAEQGSQSASIAPPRSAETTVPLLASENESLSRRAARPCALTAKFDQELRHEAEAAIVNFRAAFDMALKTPGSEEFERLRIAASELARAGARTQIVVERLASAARFRIRIRLGELQSWRCSARGRHGHGKILQCRERVRVHRNG
jgi:hypothetical protein